jgi:hypothetical protein
MYNVSGFSLPPIKKLTAIVWLKNCSVWRKMMKKQCKLNFVRMVLVYWLESPYSLQVLQCCSCHLQSLFDNQFLLWLRLIWHFYVKGEECWWYHTSLTYSCFDFKFDLTVSYSPLDWLEVALDWLEVALEVFMMSARFCGMSYKRAIFQRLSLWILSTAFSQSMKFIST